MKTKVKNVVVLFNKPSGGSLDDIDTQESAHKVAQGLQQAGYKTDLIGINRDEILTVRKIRADVIFNLVEWAGRDYELGVEVIKNLEKVGLPYTGSNPRGYELSCNKILMKNQLLKAGIPTPAWQILETATEALDVLPFPVIVKPTLEHAAIGISQASVCSSTGELRHQVEKLISTYHQSVLAEEYIDGDEAQVTVLEKRGQPWVLPPAVFRYRHKEGYWPINTYEAKWEDTHWEGKMSSWTEDISPSLTGQMQDLAKKCYVHLAGRSYPRVDIRISTSGRVYVLEVNNNPGIDFDSESGITVSAKKAGLDWPGLLTNIVEEAYYMHSLRHDAAVL